MSDLTRTLPAAVAEEFAVEQLRDCIGLVLEAARARGADAVEAGLHIESGLSVNVRLGEVDTLEYHRDKGLGVTVYHGTRKGSASTTDLSERALRETVQAACDIARYTAEDPCNGLAPAERMAREAPELDLYHPWEISNEEAIEQARATEAEVLEFDPRITNSEGASLNSHSGLRLYGNSHGFLGGYASSRHSLNAAVIAEDASGMQRDYWYTVARDPRALETPATVGRTAAERALARLGASSMPTGPQPVIFEAGVARGLIGHFLRAINGNALYRRSSFLVDSLGETLFPDWMRIDERPHLRGALGSAPFDSEGVATAPRDIVSAGVLQGYVLDSYAACRLGMETTGNAGGTHNVFVAHQDMDRAALLREMGNGVLVTDLMGQGVNNVTGDYSRGAAGFRVENGVIAAPVEEITIAGNLRDMFAGIRNIASDLDTRGNIVTGSILVDGMTVAGN